MGLGRTRSSRLERAKLETGRPAQVETRNPDRANQALDVVYYVGGPDPDDRGELRHSLRSLEQNYRGPIRDVWVVGDVPRWFTGAKMPLPPHTEKFANARQSITAYVNHTGAAERFVLMMDDVYITEPVTRLPICHLGPANEYSAYRTGKGTYANAIRNTTDHITATTGKHPLGYLAHTPVPLDAAKVRDFLASYPETHLLEPFMLYAIAGTSGKGERTGNAKCNGSDNVTEKLNQGIPFVSSNPQSWAGELGDWVRQQFPTPSRWET